MIKAIIIDDEPLAREIIRIYLAHHKDVELLDEFKNGFEGLKAIQDLKPDLVFLDVQMPKISGFEMLELIEEPPMIIFSTAFDEYAIKAFEMNAVDYLLKPYTRQRFEEALTKVRQQSSKDRSPIKEVIETYREAQETLERIVIKFGSKIHIIGTENVRYFESQDDYVTIYTDEGKFLKQMTMKYLEAHLPQDKFVRVHRSFIANLDFIDKIEAYEKESYLLHLKEGQQLSVSRSGYSKLKTALKF